MPTKKKILPHEQEKVEQFAIEGLIKGYANSELTSLLQKDYPHLEEEILQDCIKKALASIRDNTLVDVDKIIPQHIEIYEKIYQEFDDIYYVPGKLKALRGKEKLVGLQKETNFVEVHNQVNVEIEKETVYDLSKLTESEQKRLSELLQKVIS